MPTFGGMLNFGKYDWEGVIGIIQVIISSHTSSRSLVSGLADSWSKIVGLYLRRQQFVSIFHDDALLVSSMTMIGTVQNDLYRPKAVGILEGELSHI